MPVFFILIISNPLENYLFKVKITCLKLCDVVLEFYFGISFTGGIFLKCSGGLPVSGFLKIPLNTVQCRVSMLRCNKWKLIINIGYELHWNAQTFCPNMIWLTFQYYLTFFFRAFLFQKVMFWKLRKDFLFQFSDCSIFLCVYSFVYVLGSLIIIRGDFEINSGPANNYNECLPVCH